MQLQQGRMSMLEYASKFMKLCHFAPTFITNAKSMMNHFKERLNPYLK